MSDHACEDRLSLVSAPQDWLQRVEQVGVHNLLVIAESRLGPSLATQVDAEDMVQECLLQAWRDRGSFEDRGLRSFRAWLVTIIEHRIRDLAERFATVKRGSGVQPLRLEMQRSSVGPALFPGDSATPSRAAIARERASAIRGALESLEPELRDIVRLRLIEQCSTAEIAMLMSISEAMVRRRFRKGTELYRNALAAELATRSVSMSSPGLTG